MSAATKCQEAGAIGYAWSVLRSIADSPAASVETQLLAQRAMDDLRTLYPQATEGLEP